MDKALSPYVKGGGAKKYEAELKRMYGMEENSMSSQVGGFQAMTQDALTVLNDIPFSIPPYFAILGESSPHWSFQCRKFYLCSWFFEFYDFGFQGRAIVTLEGIALTGNENYGIIMESYPFIARKMLAENRPEIQQALQEVLFSVTDNDSSNGLKLTRLFALLNNASGAVGTKEGSAFVDLDAIPKDGLSLSDGLKLLLSEKTESLRKLLEDEVENIADLFFRQITRKGMTEAIITFTPPRPPTLPFLGDILSPPKVQLDEIPLPFFFPSKTGNRTPSVSLMTLNDVTDIIAPKLSREEEIYAISLADAADQFVGSEASNFLRGDGLISTHTAKLVLAAASTGFLGNRNFLGTASVKNTLNALSGVLAMLDEGKSEKRIESILSDATSKLSEEEKNRLDDIVTELTRRILRRVRERVAARSWVWSSVLLTKCMLEEGGPSLSC